MKSILLIASGVAALASGCASVPPTANYDDGVDHQKVTTINNVARARGVYVQWVNYPQRKTTSPAIVPSLGAPTGS